MRRSTVGGLVTVAMTVLLATGCGDGGPPLAPVKGIVRVNGQPLTGGSVSFRPDTSKGNTASHHPTGSIGADGSFELFTAGKPGAPAGHYKVLVFADANAPGGKAAHPTPPVWQTDPKYTAEKTTDLKVEVVASADPGRYDLKLVK